MGVGPYATNKGGEVAWVKTFNMERILFNKLQNGKDFIKTTAIAFQGTFVETALGTYPPSVCPANVFDTGDIFEYSSGTIGGLTNPTLDAAGEWIVNSVLGNLTPLEAGQSLLFMATVCDPEWAYYVIKPGEKWCNKTAKCWLRQTSVHKAKKPLTEFMESYNWPLAYNDIVYQNNTKHYSIHNCPPKHKHAPNFPVPPFRPDYPDCTQVDPTPGVVSLDKLKNVCDLIDNSCQAPSPCPNPPC